VSDAPGVNLVAQAWLLFVYQHLPVAVFVFAFGAVVGSFVNVVICRIPAGMSVISPPSRCPACGGRLSWWENFPILGWFLVRGRCRRCGERVSPQYLVIEVLVALLFLGLYAAYFMCGPRVAWWGAVGGEWWFRNGLWRCAPLFSAHLVLVAGLVAMTVIDARTFTIPIQVPLVVTLVGFAAHAVEALVPPSPAAAHLWPVAAADWRGFLAAAGGALGIGAAAILLRAGVLRYSFADYERYVKEGEVLGDYPHARREMVIEAVYLLPAAAGLAAGWLLGGRLPAAPPPMIVQALGGALLGYLVGGGLIWAVRILGTLGFGREAMGTGDIHLLGAVGAVLGCTAPVFVFVLAPFSGLLWIVVSKGLITVFRRARRELPYGPHLAVATLAVIACQPVVDWILLNYLPFLPAPGPVHQVP
jgi:leader peptidase (prepilin peptidase)/N-methyltransferase